MASLKMREKPLCLDLEAYPHIPNSELFKIIKVLPKLSSTGPWIAGGSVWRTVNNEPLDNCDVDVYFSNKTHYENACRQMNSYPYVNSILSEKKNKWNTTYQIHVNEGKFDKTIDIQFIGMSYHKRLDGLLDSFDFPVCQFGYDGKDIIMGEKALSDLQKRQLSIYRLAHPKSFLKHMLKYLNNGFTLPQEELKKATRQMLEANAWSKHATGKYDEDEDNCKMVNVDWEGYGYANRNVVAEEDHPTPGQWHTQPTDIIIGTPTPGPMPVTEEEWTGGYGFVQPATEQVAAGTQVTETRTVADIIAEAIGNVRAAGQPVTTATQTPPITEVRPTPVQTHYLETEMTVNPIREEVRRTITEAVRERTGGLTFYGDPNPAATPTNEVHYAELRVGDGVIRENRNESNVQRMLRELAERETVTNAPRRNPFRHAAPRENRPNDPQIRHRMTNRPIARRARDGRELNPTIGQTPTHTLNEEGLDWESYAYRPRQTASPAPTEGVNRYGRNEAEQREFDRHLEEQWNGRYLTPAERIETDHLRRQNEQR